MLKLIKRGLAGTHWILDHARKRIRKSTLQQNLEGLEHLRKQGSLR